MEKRVIIHGRIFVFMLACLSGNSVARKFAVQNEYLLETIDITANGSAA